MKPMKVALAHDFLVKLGGAERVLKTFADMFPDAPIFTLFHDDAKVGSVFPKERIRGLPLQTAYRLTGGRQRLLLPFMPTAVESLDFSGYDLVISSSTALMHGIVTNLDTRHVCYCHSPARYLWDYFHRYQGDNRITGWRKALLGKMTSGIREWDQTASKRDTVYVANSKNVQQRIHKYYRKESTLIYPPVDTDRFKLTLGNDGSFLIVCTLAKYKKVELAVELFNRLGHKLIVIGDGEQRRYLENIARPNVKILGFRTDEEVAQYMARCRAFLFLSDDDFGITAVEAMACGKPVIAYGSGGALETVTPGENGELFEQQSVSSLEKALGRFFIREKGYDPKKIRKSAERFSKNRFIESIRTIIQAY